MYRSAWLAIVAPAASWAVVDHRKSLWTVPELWKTHNTRFPQLVGRRTERAAHNGPQAVVFTNEEQMRKMTRLAKGGSQN